MLRVYSFDVKRIQFLDNKHIASNGSRYCAYSLGVVVTIRGDVGHLQVLLLSCPLHGSRWL